MHKFFFCPPHPRRCIISNITLICYNKGKNLSYVKKLIDRGYKVGICEQIEDPKTTKKLVKRDVIQIITPGANLDLDIKDSNYIASLQTFANVASISYSDLTTGEIFSLNIENTKEAILEELLSLDIRELVVKTSMSADIILYLKNNSNITISYSNDDTISLGLEKLFLNLKDDRQMLSTALLFNYLTTIEKRPLDYFKPVKNLMVEKRMKLDYSAISNMELVKSLDNKNFGSLFWLLDQCSTSMGSRYLKKQIRAFPSRRNKAAETGRNLRFPASRVPGGFTS